MAAATAPQWAALRYGAGSLAEVLPSAAATLGVPGTTDTLRIGAGRPSARAVVVVLVDGLGLVNLTARRGHAPYLRSLLDVAGTDASPGELTSAFPSTTAVSLTTLGTGMPPGRHGVMGYEVLDPASDRIVHQLHWKDDPDPRTWQPHHTVFERAARAGVTVVRVGPKEFEHSGLTLAGLRGGRYAPARTLPERVDATLAALRSGERVLVYLYWHDLDRIGHDKGWSSVEWTGRLEVLDAELSRLASARPPDTRIVITADHGMVDVERSGRVDLSGHEALHRDLRHIGGEPRALYLWPQPGRAGAVRDRWTEQFGSLAQVLSRDEAVAQGLFGPAPEPWALERVGEFLVLVHAAAALIDPRRHDLPVMRLRGWHGSLTPGEVRVPLLIDP